MSQKDDQGSLSKNKVSRANGSWFKGDLAEMCYVSIALVGAYVCCMPSHCLLIHSESVSIYKSQLTNVYGTK